MVKRMAIALACAAMTVAAACGGSDQVEAGRPTKEAPTLNLLSAGQACAQVQMVNDELDGPGDWPLPTYGEFGEKTASLADESAPEIADALKSMSDQAVAIGGMSLDADGAVDEASRAAGEWAVSYQQVADICARTDSPVGRLP